MFHICFYKWNPLSQRILERFKLIVSTDFMYVTWKLCFLWRKCGTGDLKQGYTYSNLDRDYHYEVLDLTLTLLLQDPPGGFSSQEKTVSLKKEPRLSLGITIAGGRDCRSRLPVYITSVQPIGCLHRDGTIKRGTKQHLFVVEWKCIGRILYEFIDIKNGTTLVNSNSIETFIFRWCSVEYQWCRPDPADIQRGRFCTEDADSSAPGGAPCHPDHLRGLRGGPRGCQQGWNGSHGWPTRRHPQLDSAVDSLVGITKVQTLINNHLTWILFLHFTCALFMVHLQLRLCNLSQMHWCRDIVLQKTNNESWGFSIVGGYEESHGQQPFFIKTIVPGTPAHFDGRLKWVNPTLTSLNMMLSTLAVSFHHSYSTFTDGLWFFPGAVMK